ncbi:MAG: hypothetical protein E3J72_09470 [Planctomycetota bacterium]|nr:MAG: hypothetical protein E3J72_09470 [Planctomycetota bacterium]
MKFSLPLILGIFVVLLFGLVIAGMVLYKPLMKLWRESGQESDVVHIRDDFKDGKLDSRFETDSSGSCSIYEDKDSGLFRADMGTSSGDAGIVYLKDALDVSKPITVKHRTRVLNANGLHCWNAFAIMQKAGYPQCVDLSTLQTQQRILVIMRSAGILQICYKNNSGGTSSWNQTAGQWVTAGAPEFSSAVSDFHLVEFHSDGTQWYIIIKDQSGSLLMQTDPANWSDVENTGEDYWFYWGDDCTTYFHGDGESDYIDIRYTPKKTPAGKGAKKRK